MKTVWIYVDTNKEVGDVDHLKVFAASELADGWFKEMIRRRRVRLRGDRRMTEAEGSEPSQNRNRVFHGTNAGTGFKGNI
jgi:hypothetical protein